MAGSRNNEPFRCAEFSIERCQRRARRDLIEDRKPPCSSRPDRSRRPFCKCLRPDDSGHHLTETLAGGSYRIIRNRRKPGEAVPQTDKQGKKISTKGHEERRRDTKGMIAV